MVEKVNVTASLVFPTTLTITVALVRIGLFWWGFFMFNRISVFFISFLVLFASISNSEALVFDGGINPDPSPGSEESACLVTPLNDHEYENKHFVSSGKSVKDLLASPESMDALIAEEQKKTSAKALEKVNKQIETLTQLAAFVGATLDIVDGPTVEAGISYIHFHVDGGLSKRDLNCDYYADGGEDTEGDCDKMKSMSDKSSVKYHIHTSAHAKATVLFCLDEDNSSSY